MQWSSLEAWTSFTELIQWNKIYVATIGNASLVTFLIPLLPYVSLMYLFAKFCFFSACLAATWLIFLGLWSWGCHSLRPNDSVETKWTQIPNYFNHTCMQFWSFPVWWEMWCAPEEKSWELVLWFQLCCM